MGLYTTHDCWHGSYSGFHNWRYRVAKAAGIDLDSMAGFGGDIEWSSLKPDVLHVLLFHSDCDGSIMSFDCLALSDRLEELLPKIRRGKHDWKARTRTFIDGLRLAASLGEDVDFR